jgi:alkyl sulfatase BDS1-like metallo-beta-lactamase superfamily hydrolase
MMRLFREYVIGGKTGSREGAWFLTIVLVVLPVAAVVVGELFGREMGVSSGLLMILCPAVLTIWATSHGLQKMIDSRLFRHQQTPSNEAPLE